MRNDNLTFEAFRDQFLIDLEQVVKEAQDLNHPSAESDRAAIVSITRKHTSGDCTEGDACYVMAGLKKAYENNRTPFVAAEMFAQAALDIPPKAIRDLIGMLAGAGLSANVIGFGNDHTLH